MKERLVLLLKEENLTAGKFAELLGVQPSGISHLISGRNKPNFDFIAKVLDYFPAIDPDWLILGKGEMYRRESRVPMQTPEKNVSLPESIEKRQHAEKQIDKLILFYTDRTFSVYKESDII